MILFNKNALVFAATGAVASEVARTFAREGATVWLSGRNAEALSTVAAEIRAAGRCGGNGHCGCSRSGGGRRLCCLRRTKSRSP